MSSNEDRERINLYFDFYGPLFTDKQRKIFNYYYHEDFSLAEIAEEEEISRAAVYDTLKKIREELDQYEGKLHLVSSFRNRKKIVKKIKSLTKDKNVLNLVEDLINTENEGGNV